MARTPRTRSVLAPSKDQSWLEDLWDEPTASVPLFPAAAEALQGAWLSVAGRREAEMLVSGDHLTVHFADGTIYMGTFTLGAAGRLATMDVRVEEGPPRHKGLTARCIFELDGDLLRWCTASPGQSERPAAFDEHDPRHLCLVFHREHTLGKS
jgi:uncharacterized protein (TIGR03067 family)